MKSCTVRGEIERRLGLDPAAWRDHRPPWMVNPTTTSTTRQYTEPFSSSSYGAARRARWSRCGVGLRGWPIRSAAWRWWIVIRPSRPARDRDQRPAAMTIAAYARRQFDLNPSALALCDAGSALRQVRPRHLTHFAAPPVMMSRARGMEHAVHVGPFRLAAAGDRVSSWLLQLLGASLRCASSRRCPNMKCRRRRGRGPALLPFRRGHQRSPRVLAGRRHCALPACHRRIFLFLGCARTRAPIKPARHETTMRVGFCIAPRSSRRAPGLVDRRVGSCPGGTVLGRKSTTVSMTMPHQYLPPRPDLGEGIKLRSWKAR